MKKISFFVAIAAAASLASCTAQAPKANMKNDVDSSYRTYVNQLVDQSEDLPYKQHL